MESGFQILEALQGWHRPWLDQLMVLFTSLGDGGAVWIVLTLLLLLYKPTRRAGCACALSLLLSLLLCNLMLKPLIQRPRPFVQRELPLLIPAPGDTSFPSGHSCSSFAFAATLSVSRPKAALPVHLLAALIAFSRLYLQVHFPGDVLAGAALGSLCGLGAQYLFVYFDTRLIKKRGK